MNKTDYQKMIDTVAVLVHRKLQKIYQLKNSGTRIKITTDKKWIKKHSTDKADIAKLSYYEIPADCAHERWCGSKIALDEVIKVSKNGGHFDADFIESTADKVHKDWLVRNYQKAPEEHQLAYTNLSEDNKDKDRVFVDAAIEVFIESNKSHR